MTKWGAVPNSTPASAGNNGAGNAVRYGPSLSAILEDANCVDEKADQRQVQQELDRRPDRFHPPAGVPAAPPLDVGAGEPSAWWPELDDDAEALIFGDNLARIYGL